MPRISLKPIALLVVTAIVLMLTLATSGTFAHEVKHATHHSAAMHTSGLCAWMCAAGGAVITPAFLPAFSTVVQQPVLILASQPLSLIFASRLQARAPPILL